MSCDDCSFPDGTCCCEYVEGDNFYCPLHIDAREILTEMDEENTTVVITLEKAQAQIVMELLVHEIEALDNEIGDTPDDDPLRDALESYNNILDIVSRHLQNASD